MVPNEAGSGVRIDGVTLVCDYRMGIVACLKTVRVARRAEQHGRDWQFSG